TRTSPVGSVVTLGYQRPAFMSGNRFHALAPGSKLAAVLSPVSLLMCPPATKRRPSGMKVCPLQKRLKPAFGRGELAPVAGSQSVGVSPWVNSDHHMTFPSGNRCACVAVPPQFTTADH